MDNAIISQEGSTWKETRDLIRAPLSRPGYQNLQVFQSHVDDLISKIPTDRPIDIHTTLSRFTMDTASSFLFGKSIGSLREPQHKEEADFDKAFGDTFSYIARRGLIGPARMLLSDKEFKKNRATVYNYIDKIIEGVQDQRLAVDSNTSTTKPPLIDALLNGKDDLDEIRDHLIFVLAAGRMTTATLLSWAM